MNEASTAEADINAGLRDFEEQNEDEAYKAQVDVPNATRMMSVDHIVNLSKPEDLQAYCDEHKLSSHEADILQAWLNDGVQTNTLAWFEVTRAFFHNVDSHDRDKYLATLLFMDAMNRADETFDSRREVFAGSKDEKVTALGVDELPVMRLEDDERATVGDMRRLVTKIMSMSGKYSKEEVDHVRWQMEHFLDISTGFQREYEGRDEYSFDEALALRFGTVGPLVDTFANIFAYSKHTTLGGDAEQEAHHDIAIFRKTVLAWQLSDDFYDYTEDRQNHNVNLLHGILKDEGEVLRDDTRLMSYEEFEDSCPRTAERMRKIYADLTSDLKPQMRVVLDDRVPLFFLRKIEPYDEEDEYDVAT